MKAALKKMSAAAWLAVMKAGAVLAGGLILLTASALPAAAQEAPALGNYLAYHHTIPAYPNHIRDQFLKNAPKDEKPPASPSRPPAPGKSSKP